VGWIKHVLYSVVMILTIQSKEDIQDKAESVTADVLTQLW
jgi:hypothetical protein